MIVIMIMIVTTMMTMITMVIATIAMIVINMVVTMILILSSYNDKNQDLNEYKNIVLSVNHHKSLNYFTKIIISTIITTNIIVNRTLRLRIYCVPLYY